MLMYIYIYNIYIYIFQICKISAFWLVFWLKRHKFYTHLEDPGIYIYYIYIYIYTLPPIIMEVENGCVSNIRFVSFRVIFHFHDYGRKVFYTYSGHRTKNLCVLTRKMATIWHMFAKELRILRKLPGVLICKGR